MHASTFGSTGALRLVDTGERPLQLLETPRLGGQLVAAARLPGASLGWFALGPRSDTPLTFPGVTGALLLERGRMQLHARVPDATGRIDLVLPLPAAPALRATDTPANPPPDEMDNATTVVPRELTRGLGTRLIRRMTCPG